MSADNVTGRELAMATQRAAPNSPGRVAVGRDVTIGCFCLLIEQKLPFLNVQFH
jgi:hypothetical protein